MSKRFPKGWHYKVTSSPLQSKICALIEFWWPKANPYRFGQRWLVWSLEEWHEKVGKQDSIRSIRRALTQLADEGIIIKMKAKHPYRNGRPTAIWIRPNLEFLATLLATGRPHVGHSYRTVKQFNRGTVRRQQHCGACRPA